METGEVHIVGMKIVNTMGIELAELDFNQNGLTVVAGNNGSGKTTLLRSIWFALGGQKAINRKPIRDGHDQGSVTVYAETVEAGRLAIERRFRIKKGDDGKGDGITTELRITGSKGQTFPRPQAILNEMSNELCIDPTRFAQMEGKQRRDLLMKMLNLDFNLDDWKGIKQTLTNEREEAGRKARQQRAAADLMPEHEDAPKERPNPADIQAELDAAEAKSQEHTEKLDAIEGLKAQETALELKIRELQAALKQAKANLKSTQAHLEQAEKDADSIEVPEIEPMKQRLVGVSEQITMFDDNQRRAEAQQKAIVDEKAYDATKAKAKAHEQSKLDAFAKAEFPLPGLGVADDDIIYNDIPFEQVNSAERIMIALEILARLNPNLRLVTCEFGSMLDAEHRTAIHEFLKANDFLALMEMVDDDADVGIVLKDGLVLPARPEASATDETVSDNELFEEAKSDE
jgi:DNA repair ATPase RecN